MKTPITVEAIIDKLKKSLGLTAKDFVRSRGATHKKVKRVAVCSGSGGSLLPNALQSRAELFITGEIKYHEELSAEESGVIVAAFGHDHTEKMFGALLKRLLDERFSNVRDQVELLVA